MPQITYGTPPGGGYRVDVPGGGGLGYGGGGAAGGGGGGIDLSWIGDFARKQAENKLRMQQLERQAAEKSMRVYKRTPKAPQPSPGEKTLRDETIATEIAKQQAMRRPAPGRYIFGQGYAGGPNTLTPNVSRMSGIQRQIFLPQAAGMERGEGPSRMDVSGFRSDEASDYARYMPNFLRMQPAAGPEDTGISAYMRQSMGRR